MVGFLRRQKHYSRIPGYLLATPAKALRKFLGLRFSCILRVPTALPRQLRSKCNTPFRIESYWDQLLSDVDIVSQVLQDYFCCPALLPHSNYVVFDLGANFGGYSLTMAPQILMVHAFEPIADNCDRLRRHVQLNALANVVVNEIALSDREGEAVFYSLDRGSQGTLEAEFAARRDERPPMHVRCGTLDRYVKDNRIERIDIIKMDVEGHEVQALMGASNTLQQTSQIVLEWHGQRNKRETTELLEAAGFELKTELVHDGQTGILHFVNRQD